MSSTSNSQAKSDYIKPLTNLSSNSQYDSTQSPLALLAQTCSSIGKDFPSSSTSLVQKSSSSQLSTSVCSHEKSSNKRSSPTDHSSTNPTKKSTQSIKASPLSTSTSFIDSSYPLTNSFSTATTTSTAATAALLLHSSLAYLSAQQHHPYSSSCSIPGCYQCETSSQLSRHRCSYFPCQAKFSTHEQLIEHIHLDHSSLFTKSPLMSSYRYHPYLKPPMTMFNMNDQLPYFYPYLSLTPMTEATRRTNKNTNNPN